MSEPQPIGCLPSFDQVGNKHVSEHASWPWRWSNTWRIQDRNTTPKRLQLKVNQNLWNLLETLRISRTASDHPDYHISKKKRKLPAASWKALPKGRFSFLHWMRFGSWWFFAPTIWSRFFFGVEIRPSLWEMVGWAPITLDLCTAEPMEKNNARWFDSFPFYPLLGGPQQPLKGSLNHPKKGHKELPGIE